MRRRGLPIPVDAAGYVGVEIRRRGENQVVGFRLIPPPPLLPVRRREPEDMRRRMPHSSLAEAFVSSEPVKPDRRRYVPACNAIPFDWSVTTLPVASLAMKLRLTELLAVRKMVKMCGSYSEVVGFSIVTVADPLPAGHTTERASTKCHTPEKPPCALHR